MKTESRKTIKTYTVLLVACLISLSLRFWLLDKRWINPDEGAHLMDGVLALNGKIPLVDFASRQPLYVYALAGTLKLFGIGFASGRLLPLTCSMLAGLVVFLMARELFNEKVGVLAVTLYWLMPLELINSVLIKTEPLVTLIICLSLYLLVLFSKDGRGSWLVMGGLLAALGFYVRQSALILPVVFFAYALLFHWGQPRYIAKTMGLFLAGYLGAFLLALAIFSMLMGSEAFVNRCVSPLAFLSSAGKNLSNVPSSASSTTNEASSVALETLRAKRPLHYHYLRQAITLHSFLFVGFGFAALTLCRKNLWSFPLKAGQPPLSYIILFLWASCLFLAYGYHFSTRFFYIDYFREFLPPMVILFSAWLCNTVSTFNNDATFRRFVVWGLILSLLFFLMMSLVGKVLPSSFLICAPIALYIAMEFPRGTQAPVRHYSFLGSLILIIMFVLIVGYTPLKSHFSGKIPTTFIVAAMILLPLIFCMKRSGSNLVQYLKFVSLAIALGTYVVSLVQSGTKLGPTYDSVWSPQALKETASYLKANTSPNDEIMSGAVIWELQAERRPFLGISHPLEFEYNMSTENSEKFQKAIENTPPRVIILDGYTQRTYLRHLPWLSEYLSSYYMLEKTTGPARYPVEIYQLKRGTNGLRS